MSGNRIAPAATAAEGRQANLAQAQRFAECVMLAIAAVQRLGIISLRDIATARDARNVRRARGGKWQVSETKIALYRQEIANYGSPSVERMPSKLEAICK